MNKEEFLSALKKDLLKAKVSKSEVEKSLAFYDEAIDDRIETGLDEAAAIDQMGSIDTITNRIVADIPPVPRAMAKASKGNKVLSIVLLAIGSPIWVSIALALAACVLAVYISLWAVVISLWACVLSFFLCIPAGIFGCVLGFVQNTPESAMFMLGVGLASCGLSIFSFLGVRIVSVQLIAVTRRFARWVAHFFKKNATQTPESKKSLGDTPKTDAAKRRTLRCALIIAGASVFLGCIAAAISLYLVDWNFLAFRSINLGSTGVALFQVHR